MRLLHLDDDGNLILTRELSEPFPPYAILSHTWGLEQDEVSFLDMQNGAWRRKKGSIKLDFCLEQAEKDGLRYFWVDTCCINQKARMEVLDAIMSMFRWYAIAEICYVFLSDVPAHTDFSCSRPADLRSDFRNARWFTRGWTLQELLAPRVVKFFSRDSQELGNRVSLLEEIHEITGIPRAALSGTGLDQFSVLERMSWAGNRKTSKAEDRAYCLTGLLGIFIVFNYGERQRAHRRVSEAIGTKYRPGRTPAQMGNASPYMLPSNRYAEMLASVNFENATARFACITSPSPTTCSWLLQHPTFVQWADTRYMQAHHGLLLLQGKPGCGKSVLMKYALSHASHRRRVNEIAIGFSFNDRGCSLERSTQGLYRSLIFQLLKQAPDLAANLENLSVPYEDRSWSAEVMSQFFLVTIQNFIVLNYQSTNDRKRRLKIFIDALDECPDEEAQEIVALFEDIGSQALQFRTEVYVCFASRHQSALSIQQGRKLVIDNEQRHRADISAYVQRHIRTRAKRNLAAIQAEIIEKANGIFLWVVLIVSMVKRELDCGRTFEVRKILHKLSSELDNVFAGMLMKHNIDPDQILWALQWVLFALRPLTGREFYFATLCGARTNTITLTSSDVQEVSLESLRRHIEVSCQGLVELTDSEQPQVRFIHESVREFLIDKGLSKLAPDHSIGWGPSAHHRLSKYCAMYLGTIVSSEAKQMPTHDPCGPSLLKRYPLLQYCCESVWEHGEASDSVDFLQSSDLVSWTDLTSYMTEFRSGPPPTCPSLLCFLTDRNYHRLITALPEDLGLPLSSIVTCYHAIFAAFRQSNDAVVRTVVDREIRLSAERSHILAEERISLVQATDSERCTVLHRACEHGWVEIVDRLLHLGADINATDLETRTALHWAVVSMDMDTVQLLLDAGAKIDAKDRSGQTAMDLALRKDWKAGAQLFRVWSAETDSAEV
jgi:hypothetical protein